MIEVKMQSKEESIKAIEFAIDILTDFCDCSTSEITYIYEDNLSKLVRILKDERLK